MSRRVSVVSRSVYIYRIRGARRYSSQHNFVRKAEPLGKCVLSNPVLSDFERHEIERPFSASMVTVGYDEHDDLIGYAFVFPCLLFVVVPSVFGRVPCVLACFHVSQCVCACVCVCGWHSVAVSLSFILSFTR